MGFIFIATKTAEPSIDPNNSARKTFSLGRNFEGWCSNYLKPGEIVSIAGHKVLIEKFSEMKLTTPAGEFSVIPKLR